MNEIDDRHWLLCAEVERLADAGRIGHALGEGQVGLDRVAHVEVVAHEACRRCG